VGWAFVAGLILPAIAGQLAAVEATFVHFAVAVVVDPVTMAAGTASFFGDRSTATAGIPQVFVDLAIAIVVESITDLVRGRAATAAVVDQPFVDLAIAIVVLTVADFGRHRTTRTAGIDQLLVDSAITVIIMAVADFFFRFDRPFTGRPCPGFAAHVADATPTMAQTV
tara:strand:+ start:983 stop:1486 length:504 start_codon:yes stop_codon:yes gene_type:complete